MNNQHVFLDNIFVSEMTISTYVKQIAEEDIKEEYDGKVIIQEGISFSR